jgi:hypothetical protein
MSVFNFMETFFFISLGITFILILLLVYHFKQRLSNLEQKSDTMLDIVNNVVKEMGVIKVLASSRPVQHPLSAFMESQRPLNDIFSQTSMNNVEVSEININEAEVKEVQEIHLAELEEEDSEDDESESESNVESDGESDEEVESEDEKVVVSDDDDDEPVKVVQVSESTVEQEEPPIVVNKLESDEPEVVSEETPTSEDPLEEYKKLAPATLKALIISKGYATDVAKMKKPQLLQILEENL